jgi:hypothetical protein
MKKARHPRYDGKYNSLRGDVMKTVLVPARQFPPTVMKSPTLSIPTLFKSGHTPTISRSQCQTAGPLLLRPARHGRSTQDRAGTQARCCTCLLEKCGIAYRGV